MDEILAFLIRYCSFLWAQGRYRFTDSGTGASFGDAYIIVESDLLRMRFVRDRGQLFLDFQVPTETTESAWYSIDLVSRLFTGERRDSAELNEEYVQFLRESLSEIERCFSDKTIASKTKRKLQNLERIRAKELFG